MKDKGVCDGCRYQKREVFGGRWVKCCHYLLHNGRSRLVQELDRGGIDRSKCDFYEEKKRPKPKRQGEKWRELYGKNDQMDSVQ